MPGKGTSRGARIVRIQAGRTGICDNAPDLWECPDARVTGGTTGVGRRVFRFGDGPPPAAEHARRPPDQTALRLA